MAHRFPFVQFEYSHNVGPPDGRYMVRPYEEGREVPEAPDVVNRPGHAREVARAEEERLAALLGHADVMVLRTHGGAAGRSRLRKKPTGPGDEVALAIVTVIKATEMLENGRDAKDLMAALDDEDERERRVAEALEIANRAVSAFRVCSADPYIAPLTRFDARWVRAGWGTAEKLKSGDFDDAIIVPEKRVRRMNRSAQLLPQQGMAAVLAGVQPSLEGEELLLRVLIDIEHGRLRAAALGLRGALELLLGELDQQQLPRMLIERYRQLHNARQGVMQLADMATEQPLSAMEGEKLAEYAEIAGALVDSWRYRPES